MDLIPSCHLTRDLICGRVHPDESAAVHAAFDRACASHGIFESEHRLVLPYGKTRWVIVRGRCLQDEHGNLLELIGVTIDVSAQKQSELQLQIQREEMSHLNRVALMGEMTASVAHELNQPLTAIANNASAARRFLERGNIDPVLLQQLLQDMVADSQRAGEVIRGIRALVRKDKTVVRSVLNLNAVIADTLRLVEFGHPAARKRGHDRDGSQSCRRWRPLPVQIQQVLLNLIMNALDAVESRPPAERRILIQYTLAERRERGSQRARFRRRSAKGSPRESLRSFLFHQANRHGHGLDHCPFHYRNTWRQDQRGKRSRSRRAFFFHLPAARGDSKSQAA